MYILAIDTLSGPTICRDNKWEPIIYNSIEEYNADMEEDKKEWVDVTDFFSVKVRKNNEWDFIWEDGFNWSDLARSEHKG